MSSSLISNDDFLHIAKLSHLPLNPSDENIASQLNQAADYVKVLNELNVSEVSPTYQVNHKENVFRDDIVTASFPQAIATSQAAEVSDGYFVTSATIKK